MARSSFGELVYYLLAIECGNKLAMFEAYLDESGTHDGASHFVLAGYVGGARSWVRLERLWLKHLADFEVEDFHATNLFGRRGSFRG